MAHLPVTQVRPDDACSSREPVFAFRAAGVGLRDESVAFALSDMCAWPAKGPCAEFGCGSALRQGFVRSYPLEKFPHPYRTRAAWAANAAETDTSKA